MSYLYYAQIKTGAPCRSERLAKYNQVIFQSGYFSYNFTHLSSNIINYMHILSLFLPSFCASKKNLAMFVLPVKLLGRHRFIFGY